jgi:hypothetical protein
MTLNIQTRKADITSRAMLCQLSVSQWSARKLDKKVSAEVVAQHSATRDAGRFNKSLLAKTTLANIASVVSQARQDHVRMSLPWLQDGTRILPVDAFESYSRTMQDHRIAFEECVNDFCRDYPSYVEMARIDLGSMFDDSDYPSVRRIRAKFSWEIAILPMPKAADFRVDLDAKTVALIQSEMDDQIDKAINVAVSDVSERLFTVVRAMADKLSGFDPSKGKQGGVFRDSLVENVREMVSILPSLNLTGNQILADLIEKAKDQLTLNDANDLRENETLRNETAKAANDIADALSAFME